MKSRILFSWAVFVVSFIVASQSSAYILPAKYIVDYMIAERGTFQALEIKQDVDIFDRQFPAGKLTAKETLYMRKPRDLRIDGDYQGLKQISVNRGNDYVVVTDGKRTDEGRNQWLLKEIFAVEDSAELLSRLSKLGVDISRVGLGRQGPQLFFIIGADEGEKDKPQIWISKKHFLPRKMIFEEKENGESHRAEIRFEDFSGKNMPSWYPGRTEVYWEDTLRATFKANQVNPINKMSETLFDLGELRRKYPSAADHRENTLSSYSRLSEMLAALKRRP